MVRGVLALGAFASGLAFIFFALFTRFRFYDDEGKMLLYTQHLLNHHALYDQLNFIYGPSYLFGRWLVFSALGIPLGNDTVRVIAGLTWALTALLLAATAWQLAARGGWQFGLAAICGIAATLKLYTLTNEPGHPQELVVLLLAASFFLAATTSQRWMGVALMLQGAVAAALILTKINVGVLFTLGLAMAIVCTGPRRSLGWTLLRAIGSFAILVLPILLMKARLLDGYGTFCFVITAALLPCCVIAVFGSRPAGVEARHLLLCAVGASAAAILMAGFVLVHGNTLAGLIRAVAIRPFYGFAVIKYGWALALPSLTVIWASAGAALGLYMFWAGPEKRRFLWPLRLFVPLVIFLDTLVVGSYGSRATWLVLPLIWLVLTSPRENQLRGTDWFFRLLLAFATCLQPLQIFPFPGTQIHVGTLSTLLVGIVLLADLWAESVAADRFPVPTGNIMRTGLSLGLIAVTALVASWRWSEGFERWAPLPNPATAWTLVGGTAGLVAIWSGSWRPPLLRLLRLLACSIIFGGVIFSGWDTSWVRFSLPLIWLVLIAPTNADEPTSTVARVCVMLMACLSPLRILSLSNGPPHLETLSMLLAGVLLFCDLLEPRRIARLWELVRTLDWDIVFACVALLAGVAATVPYARLYADSVPLTLRGCRWIRLPEEDVALLTFLTTNVEKSSDCFVARIGLMSLHLWADRPPEGNMIFGNEWEPFDSAVNEDLLKSYRDRRRLMFIDDPRPWYLESHNLEFSKFVAAQPAHAFLDFIQHQFKLLARVGTCRLLVRKERSDLDLFDCAYYAKEYDGKRALRLRLPENRSLDQVAAIELVDLEDDEQLGSTRSSDRALRVVDDRGRELLPNPEQTTASKTAAAEQDLFLVCPLNVEWQRAAFPAVRFLNSRDKRLFTIPVAAETGLVETKVPIRLKSGG
jgi:hypothetical protein